MTYLTLNLRYTEETSQPPGVLVVRRSHSGTLTLLHLDCVHLECKGEGQARYTIVSKNADDHSGPGSDRGGGAPHLQDAQQRLLARWYINHDVYVCDWLINARCTAAAVLPVPRVRHLAQNSHVRI